MSARARPAARPMLHRALFVMVLVAVTVIGGGYALWRRAHPFVASHPQYLVTAESIEVTQQPQWVRADVKRDVVDGGLLDPPPSILDAGLGARFAKAFALHPWIESVQQVTKKAPNTVEVELVYRRPVCMVEVDGGVLPIDTHGVLLPSDDFSPADARRYPRLVGIKSWPERTVGKPWGDAQVAAGAEIAAALVDRWENLKLHYIVPAPSSSGDTLFEIYVEPRDASKLATRIQWGHAPSQSPRGEPTPQEKVSRLERIAADHGSLDGLAGPQEIDVSGTEESPASPRTARVPADDIRPQSEAKLVPTWH